MVHGLTRNGHSNKTQKNLCPFILLAYHLQIPNQKTDKLNFLWSQLKLYDHLSKELAD